MSHRFEGRNLEEALDGASKTLGVERWQLTYHVLLEKRGFLGGVKRVVIEADVNVEASEPAAPPAPERHADARPPRPTRDRQRSRGGRGGNREERGGGRGRGRRREEHRDPVEGETHFSEAPEQGPESEQAKVAREWCEEVVAQARIDVVARSEENDEQIFVRLYGPDARRLTERHGELLDAIQVLANKALVGRRVEKEIELDCESFKDRRSEDLAQRAREVADRVRRGGREELLPAMTPIERRIVHLTLQDDADVTTVSRGDGFYKRVAVVPRSAEAPAQEP